MQPYPNPNYYAQYGQMPQINPYMQRMENLQQYQQTINPIPMNTFGKMVESIDIVKVTDIPMDGNTYYFPKADGTEIYGKKFMSNGQTQILVFKQTLIDEPNNLPLNDKKGQESAFNDVLKGIQDDIKILNDKVDKIIKPNKGKKEVNEDE